MFFEKLRSKLLREVIGSVILLMSISMLIPVPTSTGEAYGPDVIWLSLQTTLFLLSRCFSRGKEYFWLTIVETLLFGAVSYVAALSLTLQ